MLRWHGTRRASDPRGAGAERCPAAPARQHQTSPSTLCPCPLLAAPGQARLARPGAAELRSASLAEEPLRSSPSVVQTVSGSAAPSLAAWGSALQPRRVGHTAWVRDNSGRGGDCKAPREKMTVSSCPRAAANTGCKYSPHTWRTRNHGLKRLPGRFTLGITEESRGVLYSKDGNLHPEGLPGAGQASRAMDADRAGQGTGWSPEAPFPSFPMEAVWHFRRQR